MMERRDVDIELIQGNFLEEDDTWVANMQQGHIRGGRVTFEQQDILGEHRNNNQDSKGSIYKSLMHESGRRIGDNDVDTRKMPKEALSLASSIFSMDKTIKNVTKIRTTLNARATPIRQSGSESSDQVIDLSQCVSNYDPNFRLESHTKSLSQVDKFKLQTWLSFNKYSIKFIEGGKFDGCSNGIPISKVVRALWNISDYLSQMELLQELRNRHFEDSTILSWTEFNDLVQDIYKPFILLLSKKYVEYFANEPKRLTNTTLDPANLAYQRLVDKSRLSSAQNIQGFSHSLDNDITGNNNDNKNDKWPINTDTMQIANTLAPKGVLSQQILVSVRKKNRCGDKNYEKKLIVVRQPESRKTLQKDMQDSTISRIGDDEESSSSFSQQFSQLESDNHSHDFDLTRESLSRFESDVGLKENCNTNKTSNKSVTTGSKTLMNDLQKNILNSIVDTSHSYPVLWNSMKEKRFETQVSNNMIKLAKKEMISNLNRVVYIDERDKIKNVVETLKYDHKMSKIEQAGKNIEKENKMKDNWEDYKRKDRINKSKYKQRLDASLKEGCAMAKAQIEKELAEKVFMRESQISRLDETSSSVVEIPAAMKEKVKGAKSYNDYTEGKAAIKKYYEETMSKRIELYKAARNDAKNESTNQSQYAVSITPMLGTQYFDEAITTSVYSSESTSKHSHYRSGRPSTSPSKMMKSNNFRSPNAKKASSFKTSASLQDFDLSHHDSQISIDDSITEQDLIINDYLERLSLPEE